MTHSLNLLAFDIGASNGRGILARFDGQRMTMAPVHQFDNHYTQQGDLCTWDAPGILKGIKEAFRRAKGQGIAPDSFGIDTWGVDYGLLDPEGRLLEAPRAYRMSTEADMAATFSRVSKRRLFDITGIAANVFDTVFQLHRRVREGDPALKNAASLLFMPDLLAHALTGEITCEYTIASVSGLLDIHTRQFSQDILTALDIPPRLFTHLSMPGQLKGALSPGIAKELGLPRIPLALAGSHDTASAVAAIPGSGDFAFCSSGTWSCFGFESRQPLLGDAAFASGFGNEGSVQGGFRPLKNIMGLWLIQECRREWARETGQLMDWEHIKQAAAVAPPLRSIIDTDHPAFYQAGDMPAKIRDYCKKTGQPMPETVGEIARTCYESLALKYRYTLDAMGKMKGTQVTSLNIVGGGTKNRLLNQMAADATGLAVITGPVEGAAMGNALVQAMAHGEIAGMDQLRDVVRASVDTQVYTPRPSQAWEDAYGRLLTNMNTIKEDIPS